MLDVPATPTQVVDNGGAIVARRFEVNGVASLSLFADSAGDHMGLVDHTPHGQVMPP